MKIVFLFDLFVELICSWPWWIPSLIPLFFLSLCWLSFISGFMKDGVNRFHICKCNIFRTVPILLNNFLLCISNKQFPIFIFGSHCPQVPSQAISDCNNSYCSWFPSQATENALGSCWLSEHTAPSMSGIDPHTDTLKWSSPYCPLPNQNSLASVLKRRQTVGHF